jgi:MFS transporter, DHA1 family, multidrug resistance protein
MTIRWRRNLYALWLAQTLTIIGFSLRAPFLPFYIGTLGADTFASQAMWSGVINGGGAAVMAISAPVWGIVADRYGRKPMVLRAMCAGALTIGLMSLATSPWHLLGLRFMEGAFSGSVTASMTLVASTTPRERMGFSLGMMQMAVFSGASIGPLFGGLLADQIGFRATFLVASVMLATGALIVLTQVREEFTRPARGGGVDVGQDRTRLSALLLGSAMLAMIGVMFVLRTASSSIQPIMPLYVERLAHSASPVATLSGITLGIAGLTSAISAVMLGRLADRIGQRRILIVSALARRLHLSAAGDGSHHDPDDRAAGLLRHRGRWRAAHRERRCRHPDSGAAEGRGLRLHRSGNSNWWVHRADWRGCGSGEVRCPLRIRDQWPADDRLRALGTAGNPSRNGTHRRRRLTPSRQSARTTTHAAHAATPSSWHLGPLALLPASLAVRTGHARSQFDSGHQRGAASVLKLCPIA